MDQLAALRLFIHVARHKSISSAGRALGLSTTTASKRLQDLEQRWTCVWSTEPLGSSH